MNFNLEAFSSASFSEILEDWDDDFNLPLIIGLGTGLGALFLILVLLTVYFSFFNTGGIFLGSNFNIPGEFDDLEAVLNDEAEFLPKMKEQERENYFQGKQFQEQFPPSAQPLDTSLSDAEREFIADRGIQAYVFEQPSEHSSVPSIVVEDKLDVRFTSHDPNSAILNCPLPTHENDTVYFEVKLFEFPESSTVSIGVATKPYPLFRLPGFNRYSIAYDSTGTVRVNQPFYSPSIWPKLIEGDVLGCGFKPRSGIIFFTHNGKKVVEAAHNVKFDMYPIIGSQGPSKLDVNLGQLGYVFIEANVKKWGFGSVYGTIGIPPAYGNEIDDDTVLDKGEELPPNYPSEEDTFFGPSALLTPQEATPQQTVTTENEPSVPENKPSKIISKPPSYNDEPKEALKMSVPVEPSEVDERLYERQSSVFDQQNNDYDPLDSTSAILTNLDKPLPGESDTNKDTPLSEYAKDIEPVEPVESLNQPAAEAIAETAEEPTEETGSLPPDTTTSAEATPDPESHPKTSSKSKNKKKKKKGKKKGKK
jgi:hypothetical protein